jgi:probable LLM family oxidoreductase
MTNTFEFGIDTFGDVTRDPDGSPHPQAQVLRDVVEQAVLADQVGLDVFGVGEHHRPDFAISAPEVVLAAIAGRTRRIVLGSSVTVLSTDEPVRVYQRFSTLNAISNGRAEVILGRGSFTESYPLFGYDLAQYEQLFETKLAQFAALIAPGADTIFPPIEHGTLRTWIGVGGSPESVLRAARYRIPLTLAIIGGNPMRFKPYVELYAQALAKVGAPMLPVAVHSPGHVARTDEQAKNELWPHYQAMINRIGAERGWPPTSRENFEREAGPDGALCVGSPETVAEKIVGTVRRLGLSRFDLKYSAGTMPHETLLKSIELIGTKVAPRVRELVATEAPVAEA